MGDHFTWKRKSCQTPRTSGVVQTTAVLASMRTVSPRTEKTIGGEPSLPLWCHCVKICQGASLG
ncbi:MAG: hypothetical protein QM765_33045 [Myxococcales bacterium]